jgi:RNA polymerase sigma-70 factor (sigma-E family)
MVPLQRPPELDQFEAFVHARGPSLLRSAGLLTGDQHLAEDLVQSALARCHQAWPRLRSVDNAEAYTRRIMYHLQVSWWRRRRVGEVLLAEPPERAAPGHTDPDALWLTLRPALLRLTPAQRAVIVLRFYEDRSEAATADLLGIAVGTVKSQTAKALARLREHVPQLLDVQPEAATVDKGVSR